MSRDKNQAMQPECPTGLAQLSVIFDDDGLPCDCIFTQVNPAFESMFSHKSKDVIGKTLIEVLQPLADVQGNQIRALAEQAMIDGNAELELYFEQLRSWIGVLAFANDPKSITTVFSDRTQQKKTALALKDQCCHSKE